MASANIKARKMVAMVKAASQPAPVNRQGRSQDEKKDARSRSRSRSARKPSAQKEKSAFPKNNPSSRVGLGVGKLPLANLAASSGSASAASSAVSSARRANSKARAAAVKGP
eukprot:GSA120T00020519001.1